MVSRPNLEVLARKASGVKGERSAELSERGILREPREHHQGLPKPPGHWLGPGEVREHCEA